MATVDANGNRTTTGFSTGVNNELSTDGTFTYTYDAEGNLLTKTSIATGEVIEYDWDHRNRLVGITFKDGQGTVTETIEYEYDAFNRRITKVHDADGPGSGTPTELHYVYDGDDIVLTYDENGDLVDRYLHGPAVDQVLASEDASGDVLYALTDNLGSVRDLVDDSGSHVEHRTYDAFGNILSDNNPAVDFLFSYTGREWDADAGLQYNRARWYDATTGRWLNQDPIGFAAGDTNLYRYVGNDPANGTDPSGLESRKPRPATKPNGVSMVGTPSRKPPRSSPTPSFLGDLGSSYTDFFNPFDKPPAVDWVDSALNGGHIVGVVAGVAAGTALTYGALESVLAPIGIGIEVYAPGALATATSPQALLFGGTIIGAELTPGDTPVEAVQFGCVCVASCPQMGMQPSGQPKNAPRPPKQTPKPTPQPAPRSGPTVADVVQAGQNASGSPADRASAMQSILQQIAEARSGSGWSFSPVSTPHGAGFMGTQGHVVFAGADGKIYTGQATGQNLIDFATGAKPPSQIPGLSAQ